jgi:hypothetical protein
MMKSSAYTPIYAQTTDTVVDGSLEEGLIGAPPAADTLPTVVGQALMEVTAPASLPEGYEFTVLLGPLHNNRPYQVKVPPGGVEAGQKFTFPAPLPPPKARVVVTPGGGGGIHGAGSHTAQTLSIPVGKFRDGLFDCFTYGACHASWWTSCICPLCTFQMHSATELAIAQNGDFLTRSFHYRILTRLVSMVRFLVQWRRVKSLIDCNSLGLAHQRRRRRNRRGPFPFYCTLLCFTGSFFGYYSLLRPHWTPMITANQCRQPVGSHRRVST